MRGINSGRLSASLSVGMMIETGGRISLGYRHPQGVGSGVTAFDMAASSGENVRLETLHLKGAFYALEKSWNSGEPGHRDLRRGIDQRTVRGRAGGRWSERSAQAGRGAGYQGHQPGPGPRDPGRR